MAHLQLAPGPHRPESAARRAGPIKVVLGDDHAAARRSLRLLLDGEHDVTVIAEGGDLATVMEQVTEHHPHVLVIDLQIPNGSTIDTLRRIRAQHPDTEIVVLTMEDSPALAQQALEAGAVGFVLKEHSDGELPEAVRLAARGEEYISPHLAAGLDTLRRAVFNDGLSPRETEILRLIALGHTSAEMAGELQLSRRTVETHRARIYRKLGLHTRAELVRHALRGSLIGS